MFSFSSVACIRYWNARRSASSKVWSYGRETEHMLISCTTPRCLGIKRIGINLRNLRPQKQFYVSIVTNQQSRSTIATWNFVENGYVRRTYSSQHVIPARA